MEKATTIEDAVQSIIQPLDTMSEDENAEATDDQPSAEQEELEASDEIDAEDLDLDEIDEFEDTDVPEEVFYDVKIDGQMEKRTLEELKRDASAQGFIQKRMRENAEVNKQLEQERQALQQQTEQLTALWQQAQNGMPRQPTPPDPSLMESDIVDYMQQKAKYDAEVTVYNQQFAQMQALQQQQQQQYEQEQDAYRREQRQLLSEYIPEIDDPKKAPQIQAGLLDAAQTYGFTAEELSGLSDARYFRALNDARKYRALVKKRGQAAQPKEKIAPVKAGAKKSVKASQSASRQKAQDRLRKSGSIEDALGLIVNPEV